MRQEQPVSQMRIKPTFLLSISLFSILLGTTYRDDASVTQGEFFDNIVQSPIIAAIKSVSVFAFSGPVMAILLSMYAKFTMRPVLGWHMMLLTILSVLLMSRLSLDSPELVLKIGAATIMVGLLVPVAMCVAGRSGKLAVPEAMYAGALSFASFHALLNVTLAVAGIGFHKDRFLGTTLHPNYIGVQMACCAILAIGGLSLQGIWKKLAILTLASSLSVLVLSGSRTGLIIFGVGLVAYFMVRGLKLWQLLAFSAVALTSLSYASMRYTSDIEISQYDRGNTRAEAWGNMWYSVQKAPLVGNGQLPSDSENSYLRGWSAIGIVYILIYIGVFIALIRACMLFALYRASPRVATFSAILAGMLVGAALEGYLLETLSFAMMFFISAALAIDSAIPTAKSRRPTAPKNRPTVDSRDAQL